MPLTGKRALLTAASAGLGFACAAKLAAEGCRVAICGRDETALNRAAGALGAVSIRADLAEAADVERLIEKAPRLLGGLDILVVNAGHIAYGGLETLADADWHHAFELLLMSAVRLVRGAVPHMRAQGAGDIVFIGSASVRDPPSHLLLSSVMRLGVVGLAKTLATTLAPDGIRVNVVAPGYFATGRVQQRIEALQESGMTAEAASREVADAVPMGRIGQAEELAELVAFVASRRCGFLTGAHLNVDGGSTGFPL